MAKSTLPRRSRGGATKHREPPTYEEKVQAITDFWKFIDIMDFQGGSQAFGDIHRELIDWSESHDSLKELILMPRGHLKSTLMTVAKTLHRIYQNPNIRIFVGTATKELAAAFVREIKTYLEDQWLQDHLWNDRPHYEGRLVPIMERAGNRRSRARKRKDMSLEEQIEFDLWEEETTNESEDKKTVWRGTAIQVLRPYILKEPTVVVGAVGVQPTGFHYDELKLDDVVNYDNVATPSKRDRVTAWIDDLIAVLDDPYIDVDYEQMLLELTGDAEVAEQLAIVGGRITACGTRYDREDWYASLLTRIEQGTTKYVLFAKNIYANGKDNEDGYLWHEKWDSIVEADKRAEMTAQKFASQYLNMIVVMEEQILAPDRVIRLLPYQVKLQSTGMVNITVADDDVREIYPILVIDPAAQVGAESDFTAIAVGGKDKQGRLYLIDGSVGKWKPADTIKKMYEYADKWKLRRINVETVSGFIHFSEHIKSQFKVYRPLAINNFKPQGKKEVRIANALEPLFSNGMIYAMQHIMLNEEIRDQFLFFPRKTIHDDFPDAVASLVELSKPPVAKPVRRVNKIINRDYGGVR